MAITIHPPVKKRYRTLPAGGLGVLPSLITPNTGGYRGLIKTISAFSNNMFDGI
jgi:hypothetical protein